MAVVVSSINAVVAETARTLQINDFRRALLPENRCQDVSELCWDLARMIVRIFWLAAIGAQMQVSPEKKRSAFNKKKKSYEGDKKENMVSKW